MATQWSVKRYRAADAAVWDALVRASRNGTFLFERPYMGYHSDRFADHSLIGMADGKPVALLPANEEGSVLRSHGGLTYGGWVLAHHKVNATEMGLLMGAAIEYCKSAGFTALDYKPVPYIYASEPSQEDLYWLWRHGAVTKELNLSTAIDLGCNPGFNTAQRRKLRKGEAKEADYVELTDDAWIHAFHSMLAHCLEERHATQPVHTATELCLLHSRFRQNIRFHGMLHIGELAAGVCTYDTGRVRHLQYIATTAEGRSLDLLTPLMARIIAEVPEGTRYVDFGISNEQHGLVLNSGLSRQKWELGGSGVAYQRLLLEF